MSNSFLVARQAGLATINKKEQYYGRMYIWNKV